MEALKLYQAKIELFLDDALQNLPANPINLQEAIRYSTLNQGKRIRPAMLLAIGEIFEIEENKLSAPACALELIHCYSLVHDDLPAMDDDNLRRGKPTCHIAFNEATAILVGDAQQTLAFEILATENKISAEHRIEMIQILSKSAGVNGMVAGQQIDLNSENTEAPISLDELKALHRLKTGALIKAAFLLGACQSTKFEQYRPVLENLGESIGLAFQVQDDIIDIESDTQTLGKTQGKDEAANKSTFPKLLGLEAAKDYRDSLIEQAKNALKSLPNNSKTGKNTHRFLEQLIEFIAQRNH